MNDFEKEYHHYLDKFPHPIAGATPKAALYTPLKLDDKVVGLINVRTIHKNVYQQHHLYLLKTVGNFVVRALELAKIPKPAIKNEGKEKEWHWCNAEQLSARSKKALAVLTEREKEVLFLLLTSMPNKGIAQQLFVSAGTIKTHTLNIYQKMDVDNRTSAILKAVEWGWFI
jgi:DNA-binding NarL/FixJ family response regulator